jgi:hypothetical protein
MAALNTKVGDASRGGGFLGRLNSVFLIVAQMAFTYGAVYISVGVPRPKVQNLIGVTEGSVTGGAHLLVR